MNISGEPTFCKRKGRVSLFVCVWGSLATDVGVKKSLVTIAFALRNVVTCKIVVKLTVHLFADS